MVYFVGAGPGAKDLITVRGKELLEKADIIIYAGSLVNKELLEYSNKNSEIFDSAKLTLEEVIEIIKQNKNKEIVRLHTGDPSMYGAIKEQIDILDELEIKHKSVPGVSSVFAAAAALSAEYTLPGVSQTLILTRVEGRTPVPENEDVEKLAVHGSSMAIFLSISVLDKLTKKLLKGNYSEKTPAAIVYKASWEDEKIIKTTVGNLKLDAEREGIEKTALILVGDFLNSSYDRSLLYDPKFTHAYRKGTKEG